MAKRAIRIWQNLTGALQATSGAATCYNKRILNIVLAWSISTSSCRGYGAHKFLAKKTQTKIVTLLISCLLNFGGLKLDCVPSIRLFLIFLFSAWALNLCRRLIRLIDWWLFFQATGHSDLLSQSVFASELRVICQFNRFLFLRRPYDKHVHICCDDILLPNLLVLHHVEQDDVVTLFSLFLGEH